MIIQKSNNVNDDINDISRKCDKLIRDWIIGKDGRARLVIKAPVGSGKSHGLKTTLPKVEGGIDIYKNTLQEVIKLADDPNNDYVAQLPRNAGSNFPKIPDNLLTAEEIEDQEKVVAAGFNNAMCPKFEKANAIGEAGGDVGRIMCKGCKLKNLCGYKKQEPILERQHANGGVIVRTHARLKCVSKVPTAPTAVIDESVIPTALGLIGFNMPDLDEHVFGRYLPEQCVSGIYVLIKRMIAGEVIEIERAKGTLKMLDAVIYRVCRNMRTHGESNDDVDQYIANTGLKFLTDLRTVFGQLKAASMMGLPLTTFERKTKEVKKKGKVETVDTISFHTVDKLNLRTSDRVLMLDATYRKKLTEVLLDLPFEVEEFEGDLNIAITHVKRNASTAHFCDAAKADQNRAKLRASLTKHVSPKALLVANKRTAVRLEKDQASHQDKFTIVDFGGLRGSNKYETLNEVAVVGASTPNVTVYECQASAIRLKQRDPVRTLRAQHSPGKGFLPKDNNGDMVHPDKLVMELIQALVDDDITQAIGRVRSFRKPGEGCKAVVTGMFFPDDLKRYLTTSVDKTGETSAEAYIEDQIARLGIAVLSPSWVVENFPEFFSSVPTASRQFKAWYNTDLIVSFPKKNKIGVWNIQNRPCSHRQFYVSGRQKPLSCLVAEGTTDEEIRETIGEFRTSESLPEDVQNHSGVIVPEKSMTLLTSHQGKATKAFKAVEGGFEQISTYDNMEHFTVSQYRTNDLDDVAYMMERLGNPKKWDRTFAIRGVPKTSTNMDCTKRRLSAFHDIPKHAQMLDIDKHELPDGFNVLTDPRGCIEHLIGQMGEPFTSAACYARLSASCGLKGPSNVISVHLWFWTDVAMTSDNMKTSLDELGSKVHKQNKYRVGDGVIVDGALFNPVQVHYTTDPYIVNGTDPLPQRGFKFEGGDLSLPMPIEIDFVEEETAEPIRIRKSVTKPSKPAGEAIDWSGKAYVIPTYEGGRIWSLDDIGAVEDGVNSFRTPILRACKELVGAVRAKAMTKDQAIALIQDRVRKADPMGRSAQAMANYADYGYILDKMKWCIRTEKKKRTAA